MVTRFPLPKEENMKPILDGPPQFILLLGLLATGLTLSLLANGLLRRIADNKADAKEITACDWLLAIVFMQLAIAVVLCVRILLSAFNISSPNLDFILVWSFLVTLCVWGFVFIVSYQKIIRRKFQIWWFGWLVVASIFPLLFLFIF